MNIFYMVSDFMIYRGYWNDAMDSALEALASANQPGDRAAAEVFRMWPIAWLYRHRGNLDAAEKQIRRALNSFMKLDEAWTTKSLDTRTPIGKQHAIALAKGYLGRILYERGELEQAEPLLIQALESHRSSGDRRCIYQVTSYLGEVMTEQGNLEAAWRLCEGMLDEAKEFGDPQRISALTGVLARIAVRRGNLEQAAGLLRRALDQSIQANRLDAIADCQYWLAQIELEMGKAQQAREMLLNAREVYQQLDMQYMIQEIESLLAKSAKPADLVH
jgi:tetratricopeptide (TPR) repeat protein